MEVELSVQDFFSPLVQSRTLQIDCGSAATIEIETATLPSTQTWEAWFQIWIETLQPDISPIYAYELCLRLTDDAEIQALNAQYRQQNHPTDVLSFTAWEGGRLQPEPLSCLPVYLGDIVISVGTAYRQAAERNQPLQKELAWLATHGLLHLLGWDHPDEESLMQMLRQQDILLETVSLR